MSAHVKSRISEKEILLENLRTFKIFETLASTTLTTFVYEMGVVMTYDAGTVIRKKVKPKKVMANEIGEYTVTRALRR
jgi:hypothetical protein